MSYEALVDRAIPIAGRERRMPGVSWWWLGDYKRLRQFEDPVGLVSPVVRLGW